MKAYAEFNYWFCPRFDKDRTWAVYDKATKQYIGNSTELAQSSDVDPVIELELDQFMHDRPEGCIQQLPDIRDVSTDFDYREHNAAVIEQYLAGVVLALQWDGNLFCDPDSAYPTKCIEWLRKSDFYCAPASTQYHESYPGGLCIHTLRVVTQVLDLVKLNKFATVNPMMAIRAAIVHDWCKIGRYEQFMRNVKDEATGKWNQVPSYRVKENNVPFGHGAASMFMAQHFFKLGIEEALAIRWHQGRWNVCQPEQNEFNQANRTHPMCYLIQFADSLACTEY